MPKKVKEQSESEISSTQHMVLNDLNMIMFWIKKKKLTEEQMKNVLIWTTEALQEIKKA